MYKVVEGVLGQIDPSTGILMGNRVAESVVRDIQFISNFR